MVFSPHTALFLLLSGADGVCLCLSGLLSPAPRAGTGIVVAALYYQSATKDHGHKEKDKDAKEDVAAAAVAASKNVPRRGSLAGVGTANSSSGDHARDEEAAVAQPLLTQQR